MKRFFFFESDGTAAMKAREAAKLVTDAQIAEARAMIEEIGVVKEKLVARANGALYELKGKKNAGESKG